jgi:hypothetical protein
MLQGDRRGYVWRAMGLKGPGTGAHLILSQCHCASPTQIDQMWRTQNLRQLLDVLGHLPGVRLDCRVVKEGSLGT